MLGVDISLAVITALVIGLVQVAKTTGLPTRWCPVLALVLGVVITTVLSFFAGASDAVITGLIIGLTAVGLYSGTKATVGK